jgi:hypothetical protein
MRYLFEDYAFDTDRRELRQRGDMVPIEPQAFDLLEYLIRNRDGLDEALRLAGIAATAQRAALMQVVMAESETMRPHQMEAIKSSLLSSRSSPGPASGSRAPKPDGAAQLQVLAVPDSRQWPQAALRSPRLSAWVMAQVIRPS